MPRGRKKKELQITTQPLNITIPPEKMREVEVPMLPMELVSSKEAIFQRLDKLKPSLNSGVAEGTKLIIKNLQDRYALPEVKQKGLCMELHWNTPALRLVVTVATRNLLEYNGSSYYEKIFHRKLRYRTALPTELLRILSRHANEERMS